MKRLFHIGSFTCLLWTAEWSHAQAGPTANKIQGFSIYGTYDYQGLSARLTELTGPHSGGV